MRTRTTVLALATALSLGGCTSGEAPTDDDAGQQAPATSAPVTDGPAGNGWLCDAITPRSLATLAGGEVVEPTQVQVQDDDVRWVCEARDGQTPLIRVTIEPGEGARDAARERVSDLDDVEDGPDYLGESFTSPALVVGLTLCRDSEVSDVGAYRHFTLVAESLVGSEDDLSRPLLSSLTQTAQNLDQRYGCSPTMARDEAARSTSSG